MLFKRLIFIILLISCTDTNGQTKQNVAIFKNTPLYDVGVAFDSSNYQKAKKLLKKNENAINIQDSIFGTTLLMWATSVNDIRAMKILLEHGADPNISSGEGLSAAWISVSLPANNSALNPNYEHTRLKILLDYGADPNFIYCPTNKEKTDAANCEEKSLLMHAVSRGTEKVKLLVDAGADINYKSNLGKTAAQYALMLNDVSTAHYLIFEKNATVINPFYFYEPGSYTKINLSKPNLPITLLEDWLLDIDSREYHLKMQIVDVFKSQGQDYWSLKKHPKTIERIKKIYPNNWEYYLDKY
jgi:ankyrin repeat protein